MALAWTPWAVPGILAGSLAWAAGFVLLRTDPARSLNRRLASVLALEGTWLGGSVFFLVESPAAFRVVAGIATAALGAIPFQYLSFLGAALDTRLVQPFRSRVALVVLGTASVAVAAWVILSPSTFIGPLYRPAWATWNFEFRPPGVRLVQLQAVASLFGLAASLIAYVRATPGTAARSRARWFALAFGLRDLFNVVVWTLYPAIRRISFWGDFLANIGPALVSILYVALLAYGVLRFQLFDLDLKLKFALQQGTVGAVIATAFFAGSELLESVVPVHGTLLGLAAAGIIVLLVRPLQRLAERFADRVMGGISSRPGYLEDRKHEVYRAALEGALEDGAVSERERGILARVREQLSIPVATAERLEREVIALLPATPSGVERA